jgi:hypothetical protein
MSESDSDKLLRTVSAVIGAARESVRDELPLDWQQRVAERAVKFASATQPSRLNIFLFHQSVSGQAETINTVDIKGLDHSRFDYDQLIRRNIAIALWSNPGSRIILVTDDVFMAQGIADPRVSIVRLDLADGEPMFERVVAMLSYVESTAFTAPTIFLDSDAFLIRHCAGLFVNDFDVAVTYRDIGGQMPINEGVIIVNDRHRDSVRRFFWRYLATYLTLEHHPVVLETYGKVRRWRGGQLSINAVSGGWHRYSPGITRTDFGARFAFLPCSRYNYSPDQESEINSAMLVRALVLHLKGSRKPWLDRMVTVLEGFGFSETVLR